jgi:hypothetical protein
MCHVPSFLQPDLLCSLPGVLLKQSINRRAPNFNAEDNPHATPSVRWKNDLPKLCSSNLRDSEDFVSPPLYSAAIPLVLVCLL